MSRRDSMAAQPTRSGRRYSLAEFGGDEGRGYRGNQFCDESLVDPWKLAWISKRSVGNTTLRICPGRNPDNPDELDPYLLDDGNFGDFARCYWTWRSGGDPSTTFLLYDFVADQHYDMDDNPAVRIYNAVRNVVKQDEHHEWAGHLKGGQGRGALIVAPKKCWFVQGLLYEHGDKLFDTPRGAADDDRICLIDMGKDAGGAMMRMLQEENADFHGDITDAEGRFVAGNPIDLDSPTSAFFRFYPLESGSPSANEQRRSRRQQRGNSLGGQRRQNMQADDRTQIGFGVELAEEFNGCSPEFGDDDIDFLIDKIQPWDDVLTFHPDEKQAEILAARIPFEVLEYAWRDHPEWLPDRDSDQARAGRRATSSGGGFGRGRRDVDMDDENEDGDEQPAARSSRRSRRSSGRGAVARDDDRFADDPQEEQPARRSSRRSSGRSAGGRSLGGSRGGDDGGSRGGRTGGRGSARSGSRAPVQDAAVNDDQIPDDEYDEGDDFEGEDEAFDEPPAGNSNRRSSARSGLNAARGRRDRGTARGAATADAEEPQAEEDDGRRRSSRRSSRR